MKTAIFLAWLMLQPAIVTDAARANYWQAMYTKLAAQVQLQQADEALKAAVVGLCSKGTPVTDRAGKMTCAPKRQAP